MKITTEIQRNVKLLHLLNEKVICLTLTEKKNTISRTNWTRLHWRALVCTKKWRRVLGRSWVSFGLAMGILARLHLAKIRTTARPNSHDMLPKRTKKVRLGIITDRGFNVLSASNPTEIPLQRGPKFNTARRHFELSATSNCATRPAVG